MNVSVYIHAVDECTKMILHTNGYNTVTHHMQPPYPKVQCTKFPHCFLNANPFQNIVYSIFGTIEDFNTPLTVEMAKNKGSFRPLLKILQITGIRTLIS